MPISKLGQRRQLVIPKEICEELGLQEGDLVEITSVNGVGVIKPRRMVDANDILTPEEERVVGKGEAGFRL